MQIINSSWLLFLTLFWLSSWNAQARNEYLDWWSEVYPTSNANATACQLCHERAGGGNGWNRYGWSLRSALGVQSASESALIAALDDVANVSDGGISSYQQQIDNNAQPGWLASDENRIRSIVIGPNGQPQIQETFISAQAVMPCGVLIDPPVLTGNESPAEQAAEIRRVQTCSTTNPITTSIEKAGPQLGLSIVADGFTAPVAAVSAPGQDDVIYVLEQGGAIWKVNLASGDKTPFLDFSDELVSDYGQGNGGYDERGLLGFAFHPAYTSNQKVYTYISTDANMFDLDFTTLSPGQSANHASEVSEWVVTNPLTDNSLATAKRKLLSVAQPQFNHNGGMLQFGPTGKLFIALGDGGNRNDEGNGHGDRGNGRDNTNPLGAILRIDVDAVAPANGRYAIPNDNPFVGQAGLDEIFVYGLRNPYRFSIENNTSTNEHHLYIGDVGQDAIEELNRIPLSESGSNFGWNYKEGSFYFSVIGGTTFISATPPPLLPGEGPIPDLVDPIIEYDHNEGISIIAGFVYQANSIPELTGHYVFGDWGRSFSNPDGRLFFLNAQSQLRELNTIRPPNVHVTGFGRDTAGELYIVGSTGFRVLDHGQGSLQKLVPVSEELCFPVKTTIEAIALVCL